MQIVSAFRQLLLSALLVSACFSLPACKQESAPTPTAGEDNPENELSSTPDANRPPNPAAEQEVKPDKAATSPTPIAVHEPLIDESAQREAQASILRAAAYLLATQKQDGSWDEHPGITAMCVVSLAESIPADARPEDLSQAMNTGLTYIRNRIGKDGRVRRNKAEEDIYSAAVCLMALQTLNQPADQDRIAAMRNYLIQSQISGHSDFGYGGGLGYGSYPDLSNTHWALEAIRLTRPGEPSQRTQALWKKSAAFVSSCQVTDNKDPDYFGGKDPDYFGGFLYYPPGKQPEKPAHEKTRVVWGSLTMGALKSLLFAGVPIDDPRIQNGLRWVGHNYTLTANPGLDQGGLYYYYYMFSSAMRFLGQDYLNDAGGTRHNWRQELVEILLSRQRGEGEWRNRNPLWLEGNPTLCTAYAIKAMIFALRE